MTKAVYHQNAKMLRGRHQGATAWVVMSGASMKHVRSSFFRDKLTITVSEAFRDFFHVYAFMNHHECVVEALGRGSHVVAPAHQCGVTVWGTQGLPDEPHPGLYLFEHDENQLTKLPDVAAAFDSPGKLVMSASSAASALHFAYTLGVSTIMVCGMDGGLLDGEMNYPGYNTDHGTQVPHARLTRHLVVAVVDEIRRRHVAVHSLNPFMDLTLEDHRFESLCEDLQTVRTMTRAL